MRRRVIRIIAVAAAAALVVLIAGQAVFWSDWPRRLAARALADQLGLRVELEEMATGWSGATRVRGVRLWLPGEPEPFVSIDAAELEHTAPLALLVGGGFTLERLAIDRAKVRVTEDEAGRWNLQRVAGLVGGGGVQAARPAGMPTIPAPHVDLRGLDVVVADANDRRATLSDVRLTGRPTATHTMRLTVVAGDATELGGSINTRGDWAHELSLRVDAAHELAGAWRVDVPAPLAVSGRWTGSMPGGRVRGTLDLDRLQVGAYRASGSVVLAAGADAVAVTPKQLLVHAGDRSMVLDGGSVAYRGDRVTAERVSVTDGPMRWGVDGWYEPSSMSARLEADWVQRRGADRTPHVGVVEADLTTTAGGLHRVDARCRGDFEAGGLTWTGLSAAAAASALDLTRVPWELNVDAGRVSVAGEPISLAGLTASGRYAQSRMTVTSLSHRLGGGSLRAAGWFDVSTRQWRGEANLEQWQTNTPLASPLDAAVEATGDARAAHVRRLTLTAPRWHVRGDGTVQLDQPGTLPWRLALRGSARLAGTTEAGEAHGATTEPLAPEAEALARNILGGDAAAEPASPWAGRLTFAGTLRGSLMPFGAQGGVDVTARGVRLRGTTLADQTVHLALTADAAHATASIASAMVLDANASVAARYGLGDNALHAEIDATRVDLAALSRSITPDLPLTGEADVRLRTRVPLDRPERLSVDGTLVGRDVRGGALAIDRAEGRLRTWRRGVIVLDKLNLQRDGGTAHGRAAVRLVGGFVAHAALNLQDWPMTMPPWPAEARLTGTTRAHRDDDGAVGGDFDVDATLSLAQTAIDPVSLAGSWNGGQVHVRLEPSAALGGRWSGEVTVPFDRWWRGHGKLSVRGLAPSRLAPWVADANEATGLADVTLAFQPAEGRHAIEPMKIELAVEPNDAGLTWRDVPIGPLHARVYAGPERVVVGESALGLADGTVEAWISARRRGDDWHDHVQLTLSDVDIDALARGWAGATAPVPGRAHGRVNFYGRWGDWHTGSGRLRLTGSNLVNTDLIGGLLSVMGVKRSDPDGAGLADFRLQAGRLDIDRFIYVNGATELLMQGRVYDVRRGLASAIGGEAIGSVRPFRGSEVELLNDFGSLLRAFQGGATTFRIDGTLDEPRVRQTSLADVEDRVRGMLRDE